MVSVRIFRVVTLLTAVLASLVLPVSLLDPATASAQQRRGPFVSPPVPSKALRKDLRTLPKTPAPRGPVREVPEGLQGSQVPGANSLPRRDPVQQQLAQADTGESHNQLSSPIQNFDGIAFTGFSPPDTVGDVGPDHYIQMVNASFAIYDKTGTLLAGPSDINTIWDNFGGECENENAGDPIVIYDQASERWLFSQFTSPSSAPFFMCIAISMTNNPVTGGWHLYAFDLPASHDYMKYGVWPDGYYMSTFEGTTLGAYVFDRANMINGNAATFQYFSIGALTGTRSTRILPADWDGATPPANGVPNPFVRSVDGAVNGGNDRLEMWEFHTDWATPANSTFTLATTLTPAAFDSDMCGFNRNCIPQPNTTQGIDALSNRLMHRLQYRNINGTEHLVTNQTVDVGDVQDHAGVRWYELQRSGGGWSIAQQSTYAPDADHRWMGSAAMDQEGNIALGYSISNGTTVFPSIRYTGRLATDALGTLPQGEETLFDGAGSQTFGARWGDYSSMNVDPVDDCTFWYTQMYVPANGNWNTRIGSFRFPSCGVTATTTTLSSSANPSRFGQAVTFTAQVTGGTPTGTVTFKDGSTTLSTGSVNASGTATFTTSTLAVGTHSMTAEYGGDPNHTPSTSTVLNQVVNKADTTTTLTSAPNPSILNQPVTLTAQVTVQAPGAGTPTGTATFKDGSTTLGTVAINSAGQATLGTSSLSVGAHGLMVIYNGDGNFNSSSSATLQHNVNYKFSGFFQPVDNNGVLNVAKAGQAIPLKWRITDFYDVPVTTLSGVVVTASSLSCAVGTTPDAMEEYATGQSGFQNHGDGYYQFNWATPKNYAKSCKTMNLNLGEATPRTALFQFTK